MKKSRMSYYIVLLILLTSCGRIIVLDSNSRYINLVGFKLTDSICLAVRRSQYDTDDIITYYGLYSNPVMDSFYGNELSKGMLTLTIDTW